MRKLVVRTTLWITAIAISLFAVPAYAQATRTWVSGVGDDANPCSRTAPCKTFAGAISKTAAGGEINVLDPGGFGAVTITKSISIISTFEGGVLVSGTNGIIVNAGAGDNVLLEGLDIEGLGTGIDGVRIIGGGTTTIRKCSIRSFSHNGINLLANDGSRAIVEDSFIANNAGGISVQPSVGFNVLLMRHTTIDRNALFSVYVTGASSIIMSDSVLTGSPTSISTLGGNVISYGNNVIRPAASPTQTVPLQ
jgi:hypothetical protein